MVALTTRFTSEKVKRRETWRSAKASVQFVEMAGSGCGGRLRRRGCASEVLVVTDSTSVAVPVTLLEELLKTSLAL